MPGGVGEPFMAVNVRQVQRNFGRYAGSYDQYAVIQRETAAELMMLIARSGRSYRRILEIGCGTGFLTALLAREYPQARIVALDIAPEMIREARVKLSGLNKISYLVADGENPQLEGTFDLIVSNMVFQWFTGYLGPLTHYHRALEKGGDLIFCTLGEGTFVELYTCLGLPTPFISLTTLQKVMNEAGFQENTVNCSVKTEYFPSSRLFFRALKRIGAHNYLMGGSGFRGLGNGIFKVIDLYDLKFRDRCGVPATYHCLFVSGRKEGGDTYAQLY